MERPLTPDAPARLVLVRHALSTWNVTGRWQGQADPPLAEAGRAQATRIAEALACQGVVAVWASDLARARETAAPIARACDSPLQIDADLRELDVGSWSGRTREQIEASDPAGMDAYFRGAEGWEGGESYAQLDERTDRVIERIEQQFAHDASGTLVVVSHGGTIRSLTLGLLGLDRSARWRLTGTLHGGATTCARSPFGWRLTGYNVPLG